MIAHPHRQRIASGSYSIHDIITEGSANRMVAMMENYRVMMNGEYTLLDLNIRVRALRLRREKFRRYSVTFATAKPG